MEEIIYKLKEIVKNNNLKKYIFMIIMIILYIFLFVYVKISLNKNIENNKTNIENETLARVEEKAEVEEYIIIDIKGEVKKPGVYKLEKGSRVNDAIKKAGNLNKDANTRFINLSKILNDGDVIVIYSNKEINDAKRNESIVVETPCVCEEVKNDSCFVDNTTKDKDSKTTDSNNINKNSIININTATVEELTTLSGIGMAKAKAIIAYREENGNFKSIEEIINVSGISETIYNKIKENITV